MRPWYTSLTFLNTHICVLLQQQVMFVTIISNKYWQAKCCKYCRKLTKLRKNDKTEKRKINFYDILSKASIWRKKILGTILYFLCMCVNQGVKSILQSLTFTEMFDPLQNFFNREKKVITFLHPYLKIVDFG